MENTDRIKRIVETEIQTTVQSISVIGKGATATAYQVYLSTPPHKVVVKVGKYIDLLLKEKKSLDFLASKVHYKVPKTYFVTQDGDLAFLAMEHIEGLGGANAKVLFLRNKKHLADHVINCFMDMQSVQNDKFGAFENPIFDTWQAYYKDFFVRIFQFAKEECEMGHIPRVALDAMHLIERNFDEIFKDVPATACISHGDFWLANMLIDPKKCEVAGVIDPNNVAWVEPEFELFALTVGNGKYLRLYRNYKKRVNTSKYCDLKIELYALCNELLWYKQLGFAPMNYVKYRAKRLKRQMKKQKLLG